MNDMPPPSVFHRHDIESMNEDDVAGELIRPLCWALGYKQGCPEANLRSQVPLRYSYAYLGHKKEGKDPVLRGKPDFVCEVVSYARWVIEAKHPSRPLTLEHSQQAHTYATHPAIAAEYYVLTNGREFRVYRVGNPERPVLQWLKDETDAMLMVLRNLLGPEAIKKRAAAKIDVGKPLAQGVNSTLKIVGGEVEYVKTTTSIPLQVNVDGLRNGVVGNIVYRSPEGLIVAEVDVKSAFPQLDEIHFAMGFRPLTFKAASEYVSRDRQHPTLFQNLLRVKLNRGTAFPKTLLGPGGALLIDIAAHCYIEAVGFLEGEFFLGTFVVDYEYELNTERLQLPITLPNSIAMRTEGTFDIRVISA